MPFIVRNCSRCGVGPVQLTVVGSVQTAARAYEIATACQACLCISVYQFFSRDHPSQFGDRRIDNIAEAAVGEYPIRSVAVERILSDSIPKRVRSLFVEAAVCRDIGRYEAAGAMFRKTIDVATKHIYATDPRLSGRTAANAPRARIAALGELKILDPDIVELADVAVLDGNDAAHDEDPYTAEEAEALEELTEDLLDRLFVRPAKLAAVKAKQIAAGQRK